MIETTDYFPPKIIQILSASRSGSSLFKSLLSKSPSLLSLGGEEEPYFSMTGNGYGYTSESDEFKTVENPGLFRRMVRTELVSVGAHAIEWRLRMQWRGKTLAKLLNALPSYNGMPWLREKGIIGHYDGCEKGERQPFREMVEEMPPYVVPSWFGASPEELRTKPLLLKCPYNTLRPGVVELLFPQVPIQRLLILRNPAATINGLIDGWEAEYGFYKHLTPYGWWKFEMPDGWEEYWDKTIEERAWFQWYESNKRLVHYYRNTPTLTVRFEKLVQDPTYWVRNVCDHLGLVHPPRTSSPPLTMVTENPQPFRWKKREKLIRSLLSRKGTKELIEALNYEDETLWT